MVGFVGWSLLQCQIAKSKNEIQFFISSVINHSNDNRVKKIMGNINREHFLGWLIKS